MRLYKGLTRIGALLVVVTALAGVPLLSPAGAVNRARTVGSPPDSVERSAASQAEKGPIAHWTFDEGKGDIARDVSGNGADCNLKGAQWAKGVTGGAADFNGIAAYLEARDPRSANITGAFTISFWMKPQSWPDQYSAGVVSKRKDDAEPGYVIYADGNFPTKINLRISGTAGGQAMLTSASDVDVDVWQHWAVTYDPQTRILTWYRDGKRDKVYRSIVIGDTTNDTPVQIGRAHTWNGFYDGLLDDVSIFDRALSSDEIKAAYASAGTAVARVSVPIRWRVIPSRYPTSDVVVAGCTVKDAGAKGDGKTDDTEAFQSAMNTMARAGGGAVFVPEGRYAIRGNLKIPTGVTLRGEWRKPSARSPLRGSILMAYAGRGETEGRPFIALRQCTGVKNLSIWYPEQDAARIVPYPFCIQQMGSASGTVANVTLVNAYQGIRTNYGSYLHYFHGVYGSPLSIGMEIDFVSDTGRVDDIHFAPDYWSDSGLPGAPRKGGAHAAWMRRNGTGMLFRRYEWIYSAFVTLSGYGTGVKMFNSQRMGETNGQMYRFAITDCDTAVDILDANFAGISFTKCVLSGSDYGVVTHNTFNSRLLFHSCSLSGGKKSALLDGIDAQSILFQQCSFTNEVERVRGDLVMLGCSMTSTGDHIRLDKGVNTVTIAGTKFAGPARIADESTSGRAKITSDPVPPSAMPDFPHLADRTLKPAKADLFVVDVKKGASDCTAIIQKTLDAAAKNGGGIVFLPGGIHSVHGHLVVPSGVELRGVYDVEHFSRGLGSVLRVYAGRNDENGAPFIVMKANSGMRGLSFYYPEQLCDAIVPYPFLIQGRGADIYVINVNAMNPYKMLDFRSYRCDRHYIEYPAGAPLKVGIAVGGGSVGGTVMNTQFNSNNWAWSAYADCPGMSAQDRARGFNPAWAFQYKNLDAFVYGDCKNETQYQNCVFGSHIGLHFVSQNGKGASGLVLGQGNDGSEISMAFDGLGPNGIDVINSQLVSMDCAGLPPSTEKQYIHCGEKLTSAARMYNTTCWGTPANAAVVNGGSLSIELASFCMYGPFLADRGTLNLTSTFLGGITAGSTEIITRNGGRVSTTGCLSRDGMRRSEGAPSPRPLPVGAPMFFSAGNDVAWQPVVPPGQKQFTAQEAAAAISHRAEVAHRAGITSLEPYVKWWLCEPQPGKWDFSYYDLHDQAVRAAGMRWLPLMIAGPGYGTPPWFKASKESVPSRCLEHGTDAAAQSIWSPYLRPRVSEFLRRFAEHFDVERIESLQTGVSGDFGETLYTEAGNIWTYLNAPYHAHPGYWCADPYARADFRRAMCTKYKSIRRLNEAWGTAYAGFGAVGPFVPDAAPNRRARLDMQRWYCAAMTDYLEFWLREMRRFFPKSRVLVAVGGDGWSTGGGDFSAQAEVAARYQAGLRVTNEASDYASNFMVTRQVTTACRFYGTYSGIEPAGGVTTEAIPARVYNATASGADELFTYDPEPEGDRGQRYSELRKFLVKREPMVDVGLFLNRTSWDLDRLYRYWDAGAGLRSATDFDIVDERLIEAGVLKRKRVLFWLDGPIVEESTARSLETWVRTGGLLVVQSKGRIETVEGRSLPWLAALTNGTQPTPDRYRIEVGNPIAETGLIGRWNGSETGCGFAHGSRWSTDGSQIDLPIPGHDGVTVAATISAAGPRISDQVLLVDNRVVGRAQHAGIQVISFYLSPAEIAGRKSIRLTFGGPTWSPGAADTRQLGVVVGMVAVGSGKINRVELTQAPVLGYTSGLTMERLAHAPYTHQLGRGAVVYLPVSNLTLNDVAREAVYHPSCFLPGATAPYPMIESDGSVYVTRFHNASPLFLNNAGKEAHIRYAGHSMSIPAYSIRSLPE